MALLCEKCEQEFQTAGELKSHMRIHEERGVDRSERVPFGTPRLKLKADIPEGKVGRWFNDVEDRIQRAERGGYDFVRDPVKVGEDPDDRNRDLGSKVCKVVGTQDDGSPITGYLMVIDKELYDKDQAEKQKRLDKVDAQIYGGTLEEGPGDNRYFPTNPKTGQRGIHSNIKPEG